MGKSINN